MVYMMDLVFLRMMNRVTETGRVLEDIRTCIPITRWEFRSYPDDQIGLVGYIA